MTILEALRDPQVFGGMFGGSSWTAWEALLAACFGLPMAEEQLELYRRHTGRQAPPAGPAREAWLVVGRRGGKSRVAATVACWLASKDYRGVLAPGEIGTLPIIAADRRQARTVMGYVTGLLRDSPLLARLVVKETAESVELATRCRIEIHTASWRALRGYTVVAAILDEVAFWRTDDSANPDREIVNALRPAMATVPGALLVGISSPYARRGVLWEQYRHQYGQDGEVLVWQAPTRAMNPGVSEAVIATAYAEDEAAAAAEYGAEFRRDIESYVSREAVEACVIPGRHELPPVSDTAYVAFADPSGGSQDSMTLAIAHQGAEGVAVLDVIRERVPPFSPEAVVQEFAATLKAYGIGHVTGDRYAGEWPREQFRKCGVEYLVAEKPKSDLYRDALPLLNSGKAELVDHPRLLAQLCGLERRTARGGKDSIDHGPHGRDDVANAAAGALVLAARPIALDEPRFTNLAAEPRRRIQWDSRDVP